MKTLKENSKYLVMVDANRVSRDEVEACLKDVRITVAVINNYGATESIEFYEIKRPFWSGRDWTVFRKIYDTIRLKVANMHQRNQLLKEVLEETRRNNTLLREILHHLKPKTLTASVTNVFKGELPMADNVLVLNVGQTSIDTLTPRLTDGITPSGGVISNVVVTFSDPSATAVLQPDNTILFTGVAASTGPISGSTALTITDTDSAVSTWNIAFTVQTNAPIPPSQLTQSVANVFSVPTP